MYYQKRSEYLNYYKNLDTGTWERKTKNVLKFCLEITNTYLDYKSTYKIIHLLLFLSFIKGKINEKNQVAGHQYASLIEIK